jgi:hypothetical protein
MRLASGDERRQVDPPAAAVDAHRRLRGRRGRRARVRPPGGRRGQPRGRVSLAGGLARGLPDPISSLGAGERAIPLIAPARNERHLATGATLAPRRPPTGSPFALPERVEGRFLRPKLHVRAFVSGRIGVKARQTAATSLILSNHNAREARTRAALLLFANQGEVAKRSRTDNRRIPSENPKKRAFPFIGRPSPFAYIAAAKTGPVPRSGTGASCFLRTRPRAPEGRWMGRRPLPTSVAARASPHR